MDEKINNHNDQAIEEICREEKLSELEIVKQSVDEQKKKAQDYYEQILCIKADFENFRKRSERERKKHFDDGKSSLIKEIVDIFDTVKLAKSMMENAPNVESIHQGLHLIEKKLAETLSLHDVLPIVTLGEKYDPFLHEVVGVVENDSVEEDVILEEVKAGYKVGERVLKPAMVKIAKRKVER